MIVPAQSQNLQVKPRWVAPVGVMESVVAYNCRKYGMPLPVLAMPMWEGAGNRAFDLSGHGRHGTFTGAPSWVNDGLDFDGINDYIDFGHILNVGTSSFAVSAWIKIDAYSTDQGYDGIIGKGVGGKGYFLHLGGTTNQGKIRWYTYDGSGRSVLSNSALGLNTLYHVLGVVDKSSATGQKLYINGVEQSATASGQSGNLDGASEMFVIGADDNTYRREFNGTIGNVYMCKNLLAAAQIKFLYDNPYFMYRLPEELYGYTTGAPPAVSIPVFMHHYNQLRGA